MIDIKQNTEWLIELLGSCEIPAKELEHRKNDLKKEHNQQGSAISRFSDRYYNLAHEIKSFYFLRRFGNVSISLDSRSCSGCDCKLNDYYQVECVCSSAGKDAEKTGLAELCTNRLLNGQVIDYKKKRDMLFCRLTNSISKKLQFYDDHLKNKTINPEYPYLIFLGLGALSNELFSGDYGIEFTSVLFGKGDPTVSIDMNTGCMSPSGYTHIENIIKHNKKEINCNIFLEEEYRCVSGIIISKAHLYEEYTSDNTWLFLNPNAYIKINPNEFKHIVYWDLYEEDNYGPYRDGQRISNINP